jgi:STIP1 family protein 1
MAYVYSSVCDKHLDTTNIATTNRTSHNSQSCSSTPLRSGCLQAHYLLGVAQRELGGQLPQAISHLSKALEQAREKGDSIKDEIWRELARAKYQQWQQDSQARTATAAALKQQLQSMLQAQRLQGEVAGAAAACGQAGVPKETPEQQQQAAMQQWEELLHRAAHLDSRTEVPAAFTCPLTMEVR